MREVIRRVVGNRGNKSHDRTNGDRLSLARESDPTGRYVNYMFARPMLILAKDPKPGVDKFVKHARELGQHVQ